MAYIDYKEINPGVKSDFSVMELDQRQVEIIRASLNNSMVELTIRKHMSPSNLAKFSNPENLELMQVVQGLCDIFNSYCQPRPAPAGKTQGE